jgi:hypothetical protein
MTSYTLQVQPQTQYTIEYSNQRGPQGATGPTGPAGTGLSAIASGTILGNGLGDTALPQALNAVGIRTILGLATFDSPTFVGLTLTGLQQFSGTTTVGLRLKSLTTAEYNALTAANGDLYRDSTTDRIDARLARGTVELIDTAGGQTINGTLGISGFLTDAAGSNRLRFDNNGSGATRVISDGSIFLERFANNGVVNIGTSADHNLVLIRNSATQVTLASGSTDFTGNLTASGTITYSSIAFPELVTNGGFDTDTAWSKGAGWTISGGVAVATGVTGSADIQQNLTGVDLGRTYIITFNLVVTSGNLQAFLGANGNGYSSIGNFNVTGSHSYIFHKGPLDTAKTILFRGNSTFTGTIDNVSVKRAF